jgi:hypothetical protein
MTVPKRRGGDIPMTNRRKNGSKHHNYLKKPVYQEELAIFKLLLPILLILLIGVSIFGERDARYLQAVRARTDTVMTADERKFSPADGTAGSGTLAGAILEQMDFTIPSCEGTGEAYGTGRYGVKSKEASIKTETGKSQNMTPQPESLTFTSVEPPSDL